EILVCCERCVIAWLEMTEVFGSDYFTKPPSLNFCLIFVFKSRHVLLRGRFC
ncbi:hypothetical protein ALC56_12816, partial [Trachymyrmex septentrionalis]